MLPARKARATDDFTQVKADLDRWPAIYGGIIMDIKTHYKEWATQVTQNKKPTRRVGHQVH